MANPQVSGQDLLDSLNVQLGSLSNAFTVDQKFSFLNQGTQEVWAIGRSLDLDNFTDVSEDTDSTQDEYFVDLTPQTREYALPANCRELRLIECLTVGFEGARFIQRRISDPDFQEQRRSATANGASIDPVINQGYYYYAVFGNQFVLAAYPNATLNLKLWYIRSLDAITVGAVPAILWPFNIKIVDYATERAILSSQNASFAEAWLMQWKESVKTIALSLGPRASTDAIFITDYEG